MLLKYGEVMRKYLSEFIGTFALVFAGTGSIIINDVSGGAVTHVGISLTFGLIVMSMVYTLGNISGAHINPAVTFGFWISGRFPGKEVLPYAVSQSLGGLFASLLLLLLFQHPGLGATLPSGSAGQSFVIEIILTFLLMFVILNVASASDSVKVMAGAAIGAVVALEALFAGPITGASMNPARSLAPALVSGKLRFLWIYLSAPFLGSSLAVAAFKCVSEPAESK